LDWAPEEHNEFAVSCGGSQNNREKENDLVVAGILPVILNRQAGSLSYHSVLPSYPIRYGCKTFENCYNYLPDLEIPSKAALDDIFVHSLMISMKFLVDTRGQAGSL
jgi:hypothetical protein